MTVIFHYYYHSLTQSTSKHSSVTVLEHDDHTCQSHMSGSAQPRPVLALLH